MKKTATLLLALTLLLATLFSGCSEKEKDAYTLYTDMNKAMADIKSVEIDIVMSMDMAIAGENASFDFTGNAQQIIKSETDVEMAMELNVDMSSLGLGSVPTQSYYKDGYMYQDMMGMKSKMAMNAQQMIEQAGLEMFEFNSDAVVSSEVTDVDGGKQLAFVLKGDMLTDMVDSLVAGQLGALGVGDMNLSIGDASYTAVVGSDNLPTTQLVSLTMSMEVEGETAEIAMEMSMSYTSFNSIDSIAFPSDLDSYTEY